MLREILLAILIASVLLAGCVADQPPEKGTLQLTSSPPDAEIYLDSQFKGTTPSTITGVEPGSHMLEYRLNGYTNWESAVTVPSGTSHYFAELAVQPAAQPSAVTTYISTGLAPGITVRVNREEMIVGDSIVFSGTCTGCTNIVLTLYGPGYYTEGVILNTVKTDSINAWSYTWNPGSKVQSGSYTIVVNDAAGTVSARQEFRIIGNGVITVIPSSYSTAQGNTITFSGICSTGARNVQLVLFGPERYSTGVNLGTYSVNADNTWSFKYKLDSTMPNGIYSITVNDVPRTNTGNSQFTVLYTS